MGKFLTGCLTLIGAGVVLIIIIAAVGMSGGGDDSGSSGGSDESAASDKGGLNAEAGKPNRVKKGKAFRLGDFQVRKGWRVKNFGQDLGYSIENLEVENVTDDSHAFNVEFKLRQGKSRVVAGITCFADEAAPNDIVEVDCVPDGTGKKFGYITVENAF